MDLRDLRYRAEQRVVYRGPDQIACCELLGLSARTGSDVWTVGQGGYFAHIKGTFTMHYGSP